MTPVGVHLRSVSEGAGIVAVDRTTAAIGGGGLPSSGCLVTFPAYYYERWLPSGLLTPPQHIAWQYLVSEVCRARAELDDPLVTRLVIPLDVLARVIGVRSLTTVRSQVIRPIRDGQPLAEFIPEVAHLSSGSSGWLESHDNSLGPLARFTVAMTVPVLPADEKNPDVASYPERRVVRSERAGQPEARGRTKDGLLHESALDWSSIRNSNGSWPEFRDRVLEPVMLSVGQPTPEAKIEAVRPELTTILDSLGWARAVDEVYRIAPYLADKRNPVAYLRKALRATNGSASSASPVTLPRRPRPPASVERQLAKPSLTVMNNMDTRTENEALERLRIGRSALLASWLDDLKGSPSRLIARQALDFVRDRRSSSGSGRGSDETVLLEIERLAIKALGHDSVS